MPLNISKLGKVLKTLNRLESITFNTSLPIKIEVKKELNPITYLIKLGNKEVETKSSVKLEVGKSYLAQVKELKNQIEITNLKEYPRILEKIKLPTKELTPNKEEILNHLANAKTKEEFLFLTNILIAYEKKIYHLVINDKRKAIMQFKYKKNSVKFYACFSILGEMEGIITENELIIYSFYQSTLNFINAHKNKLNLKLTLIKKEPKPIYTFTNSLLDIKV